MREARFVERAEPLTDLYEELLNLTPMERSVLTLSRAIDRLIERSVRLPLREDVWGEVMEETTLKYALNIR